MIIRTAVVLALAATPAFAQILQPVAVRRRLPTFSEEEARATGPGHPWQGGPWLGALNAWLLRDMVNPASLSLQAQALLVTLQTPSGLSVPFSLNHHSQAAYSNLVLGTNWNHSLWVLVLPYVEQDGIQRMGVYWGNHREQRFKLVGVDWRPADGYLDTLQVSPTGATLTFPDQTRVEFEPIRLGPKRAYRLDRIVDTSGHAIDVSYDALGRVASATDPVGRTLTLTYNAGRLRQVRYAYGTWSRTWDIVHAPPNNRLAQVVYPPVSTDAGVQTYSTAFEYNTRGNIVKVRDPEGQVWQYGYDPVARSRLAWAQWPGNTPAQRCLYSYVDPLTRAVTDPIGVTTTFRYDEESRLVGVEDALGNVGTAAYGDPEYDWAPSEVVAPSGTTWRSDYDARGNVVGRISLAGHRTDYAYDSFNNLVQVLQPLVTDAWANTEPARRQTDLVYDSHHRLTLLRRLALFASPFNEFHEWSFLYNGFGQVTHATNPLGRTTEYTYDPLGNLTRATSPAGRTYEWQYSDPEATFGFTLPDAVVNGLGQLTKLVRDEWGRLRVRDYPTSPDERYSYDGLSRLVRTEGGPFAPPTVYTYHPAGGLFTQQRGPQFIQIDRLPNGLPSTVTEGGVPMPRVLQYQYGPRNELTMLTDSGASITFAYDEDLRLTTRGLPNGASASFFYLDGRLASITHGEGTNTPFASFAYDYQSNGQRMRAVELGGAATVRYGYDLIDRLVREERTGAVPYDFQWAYDATGNRISQSHNGQPTSYSRDLDGLLTQMNGPMGLWTYVWDAAARLVRRTQPTATDLFGYDDAGRLIHADHAEQGPLMPWRDYAYGAIDQRIMRMAFTPLGQPESQTGFFDLATAPFREERISFPAGGQSSLRPTFAGGLVRWLDATTGQCMYPATDADGSVRAWTDNAGAVGPYTAVYNAFGQAILDQGPRPPYAFAADSGVRNDGDFGWLALPGGAFYSPLEQIIVGISDGGAVPAHPDAIPWWQKIKMVRRYNRHSIVYMGEHREIAVRVSWYQDPNRSRFSFTWEHLDELPVEEPDPAQPPFVFTLEPAPPGPPSGEFGFGLPPAPQGPPSGEFDFGISEPAPSGPPSWAFDFGIRRRRR